ncbi:hypothetical protein KAU43_06290 [candidate division WOR-3 bacterium]|nr:hypothetical protein [candidate division WOR-3 bacterium]
MKQTIKDNFWIGYITMMAIFTLTAGIDFLIRGHLYGLLFIIMTIYFVWAFYIFRLYDYIDNMDEKGSGIDGKQHKQ